MDKSLSAGPTVRGGRGIKYPESDGKPMGETGVHVDVMLAVLAMLRRHYSGNDRVAVLANMFLYYKEGDPRKVVCPDVFVTLNVPSNTKRRTFKLWEEGKGPDLVIEITSKKTRKEDLHKKFDLYRDVLGVREYFLFDPLEEYLEPSLQGFRLTAGATTPSRGPAQDFSARFWASDSRETRWTCGSSTRQQDDGYRRERNSIKP